MVSIDEVRRERLRQLVEKQGGAASLAKLLGHSGPSYISQVLSGRRKLGEKAARKIEEQLDLEDRYFDSADGELPFAGTDRSLIATVIRAVGQALAAEQVDVEPAKFAELVALAYEQAAPSGHIDVEHLRRLIKLLK